MVTAVRPFFTYASHERILVAKVREYDYSTACGVCVKSKNSPYEQYDLRIERERQAAGQQPS